MKNETNEVIDITFEEKGNEEIKVVEGVIEDATMNTLKIKTKDGKIYCFDTSDADKSGVMVCCLEVLLLYLIRWELS